MVDWSEQMISSFVVRRLIMLYDVNDGGCFFFFFFAAQGVARIDEIIIAY